MQLGAKKRQPAQPYTGRLPGLRTAPRNQDQPAHKTNRTIDEQQEAHMLTLHPSEPDEAVSESTASALETAAELMGRKQVGQINGQVTLKTLQPADW